MATLATHSFRKNPKTAIGRRACPASANTAVGARRCTSLLLPGSAPESKKREGTFIDGRVLLGAEGQVESGDFQEWTDEYLSWSR